MTAFLAYAYALAALGPIGNQLGLLAGRPWGHLTMGGRWPGRLPPRVRPLAGVQAALLAVMVSVVLDRAGVTDLGWPGWAIWPVLGLTLLTTFGNLVTPSRPERLLWGPMTVVMSAAILGIVFL